MLLVGVALPVGWSLLTVGGGLKTACSVSRRCARNRHCCLEPRTPMGKVQKSVKICPSRNTCHSLDIERLAKDEFYSVDSQKAEKTIDAKKEWREQRGSNGIILWSYKSRLLESKPAMRHR